MDLQTIDWAALERLRTGFLDRSAGAQDYWQSFQDLASYDQTFAQRIGWKWDYVLRELSRRGWNPPKGTVLDWGCGSGIAGRAFLDQFGMDRVTQLVLWDRSQLARDFAQRRAQERFPDLPVGPAGTGHESSEVLLLSHVLSELDESQLEHLIASAAEKTAVLWVESGDRETSRRLSLVRERLRDVFKIMAPCTHQARCGVLRPGDEAHWCHHFATPPRHVFTDGNWARFAALAGIDLRSLPLSFVVFDKRPIPEAPPGAVRVIGLARVHKGYGLLLGCDAEGVAERRLTQRRFPAEFKQLRKGRMDPLQIWETHACEIAATKPM